MSIETEIELKAKELISLFFHNNHQDAKQFAIFHCKEIMGINMIYHISHDLILSEGRFYELVLEKIKTL